MKKKDLKLVIPALALLGWSMLAPSGVRWDLARLFQDCLDESGRFFRVVVVTCERSVTEPLSRALGLA